MLRDEPISEKVRSRPGSPPLKGTVAAARPWTGCFEFAALLILSVAGRLTCTVLALCCGKCTRCDFTLPGTALCVRGRDVAVGPGQAAVVGQELPPDDTHGRCPQ